jgi:hypothetical protein
VHRREATRSFRHEKRAPLPTPHLPIPSCGGYRQVRPAALCPREIPVRGQSAAGLSRSCRPGSKRPRGSAPESVAWRHTTLVAVSRRLRRKSAGFAGTSSRPASTTPVVSSPVSRWGAGANEMPRRCVPGVRGSASLSRSRTVASETVGKFPPPQHSTRRCRAFLSLVDRRACPERRPGG